MVDPYFDSLKNADAVEPRFKLAWNELDPAGAPLDTSQLQSTMPWNELDPAGAPLDTSQLQSTSQFCALKELKC
ncbi:hypothetical protein QL285_017895 [Trifolium repens]|nr:hypothetical protein QL285_017895 [Trifolium repens]